MSTIWCPHVKRPGHPSFKEKQMCNTFKKHLEMKLFLAKIYLKKKSQEIPCHLFPLNSCLQLCIKTNTLSVDRNAADENKYCSIQSQVSHSLWSNIPDLNTGHTERTFETAAVMNECYRETIFLP